MLCLLGTLFSKIVIRVESKYEGGLEAVDHLKLYL